MLFVLCEFMFYSSYASGGRVSHYQASGQQAKLAEA